jgi:catechol 2,3-dioxygenase
MSVSAAERRIMPSASVRWRRNLPAPSKAAAVSAFDLRFTHVGIYVRDIDKMATFYKDVLGLIETDRGAPEGSEVVFLSRDPGEHHQIILFAGLSRPPLEAVINQISFRLPDLETLIAFHNHLIASGTGDDVRPINHGNAWSVYLRDPEQNRIETYVPTPWYVSQPCREPLEIGQPAAAIRKATEEWCRAQPSFCLAESFRAGVAARIAATRAPTA